MRSELFLVVVLLAASVQAGDTGRAVHIPLPADALLGEDWRLKAFPQADSGHGADQCVEVRLADDESAGRCLGVGPWTHGRWSARVEYVPTFPAEATELRGLYRTEGLLPGVAVVSVEHLDAQGSRITRESVRLSPSREWRAFTVRLDRFAPGATEFRLGFGLAEKMGGKAWFAGLSIQPLSGRHPLADLPAPVLTRPQPPARQKATGFFRVGEFDQVWWLIDPQGLPFYSIATDGVSVPQGADRATHCAEVVRQLRAWGFNSLAGWTNLWHYSAYNCTAASQGRPLIPVFHCINFHVGAGEKFDALTDRAGRRKDGEHGFPDPFDPRFADAAAERARQRVELVRGQEWFVGWFVDNEIDFDQLYLYVWSRHCSEAFVRHLRGAYKTIAALNARWHTEFESFDALGRQKPEPETQSGPMYEDFLQFERVLVRKYTDATLAAVRDCDPGHLVCSNRFMLGGLPHWLRTIDLAEAYDIVAVNLYPTNREPGLDADAVTVLEMVHERTGRPVLVSEWSVPALDSGLYEMNRKAPLDWSWPQTLATQEPRATQAAWVTADYYNLPFVVGAHWFTLRDFDSDERQANRGLVRADGRPWEELTQALSRVHARINEHTRRSR